MYTYAECCDRRMCIKQLAWLIVIILSLLIIASRKHYTVDVVVAWYTVNLVVFFVDKKLPELPDRTIGATSQLLPLIAREKDSRSKEEHNKLLNGNSGDNYDWNKNLINNMPAETEDTSQWKASRGQQQCQCPCRCTDERLIDNLETDTNKEAEWRMKISIAPFVDRRE
ncbi:hypothetical protein ACLOJK_012531 [Asimina triloba]